MSAMIWFISTSKQKMEDIWIVQTSVSMYLIQITKKLVGVLLQDGTECFTPQKTEYFHNMNVDVTTG